MNTRSDVAEMKMMEGYNCAQSVLYSVCDKVGLDAQTALKLATGFGAGMARRQEVCGAISGGIFALSLCLGRGQDADKSATEYTYARVQELMANIQAQFGSCICRELLGGIDLNTREGQAAYQVGGFREKVCIRCVRAVVNAVEEMV